MLAALTLALIGQSPDHLGLLRIDPGKAEGKKAGLFVSHSLNGNAPLSASDGSFFQFGGQRPIRSVFTLDIDSDGRDEIGVIRELLDRGGRYVLTVHDAPEAVFDDASQPVVKMKQNSLGTAAQFGEIVDADGIDVDGDFQDELMIVRRVGSGQQRLEIFETPGMNGTPGPVIASFLDLGVAPFETVVHAIAVDMNGDAVEEVLLQRQDAFGNGRVDLVTAPKTVDEHLLGTLGSAAFSPPPFSASLVFEKFLDLDASDIDNDGVDELLVLREIVGSSTQIDAFSLPIGGSVTMVQPSLVTVPGAATFPVREVLTIRGSGSKPNANVESLPLKTLMNGTFSMSFSHTVNAGAYTGGSTTVIGPFPDSIGKLDLSKSEFTVTMPTIGQTIGGVFNEIGGGLLLTAPTIVVAHPSDPTQTFHLTIQNATVKKSGAAAVLEGKFSGWLETPSGNIAVTNGSVLGFAFGS